MMDIDLHTAIASGAFILWAASTAYVLYAIHCVLRRERMMRPLTAKPPVTILKPLYRLDPGLYENLRSFCVQDYPDYQVVFGVRDPNDPALAVVWRLIQEFPDRDIAVVADERAFGSNLKVSNLINMYGAAKHELIVIADSDMRVGRDYLAAVVAEFADPSVGAVTCLYRGSAVGGLASRLGAMFINEWFLPSVLVALSFQDPRFCFGATMAVRRRALEAIGGFLVLSRYLADDHMLGKLVDELGLKVRLCPYIVENIVTEPDIGTLFRHELRWARTVRTVQPLGFALSFVTYAVPMSVLVSIGIEASLDWDELSFLSIVAAVTLRMVMHFVVIRSLPLYQPADAWLVPLRDVFSFAVWAVSFLGRKVHWKDQVCAVLRDGRLATKGSLEWQ